MKIHTHIKITFLTGCCFLASLSGCDNSQQAGQPNDRSISLTILLPDSPDMKKFLRDELDKKASELQLTDGTKISISLVTHNDMAARHLVIGGAIKPPIWIVRHPALTDLEGTPVSTLGVKKFNCSPLGEQTIKRIGADFDSAKYIRLVDPDIDVTGMIAVSLLKRNIARVITYPSAAALQSAKLSDEDATVVAEQDVPKLLENETHNAAAIAALNEKLILSSCVAESELFSTRENVAALTVNAVIKKLVFPNFAPPSTPSASNFRIKEESQIWNDSRPRQNVIAIIDSSSTMLGRNAAFMEAIVRKLDESLQPGATIKLLSYNKVILEQPTSMTPEDILKGLTYTSGNSLIEAIERAVKLAADEPTSLVIFSDNPDASDSHALDQKLAFNKNLQIYGFAFGEGALTQLTKYSKFVGGQTVSAEQLQDALTLAADLAR